MSKVTEFGSDFIIANQHSKIPLLHIDDDDKQKLTNPATKRMNKPQENNLIENINNQNIKKKSKHPTSYEKTINVRKTFTARARSKTREYY